MRRGLSTTLADLLVADGVIAKDVMNEAWMLQKQNGRKLEHILVEKDLVDDDEVLSYSSRILESVPIHLEGVTIPNHVLELVPGDMAVKHQFIPIARTLNVLTVAMANPWDIYAIDNLENHTKLSVSLVLSNWKDIQEAIRKHYSSSGELLDDYLERIQQDEQLETIPEETSEPQTPANLEQLAEDAPIIGLVNLMIRQAIEKKASDIHIEPYGSDLRVRYRLDGILEETNILSKSLMPAIVSRIKIISHMDIAERRQPQDGRLRLKNSSGNVSFRISTLPTVSGEKVVMRILDEAQAPFELDRLGMSRDTLERYIQNIHRPYGMILVSGPTGSG